MNTMNIVVMGTGPFAVPALEKLAASGHRIVLCVTRPVPEPLLKKLPPRPVWEWATRRGTELFEPPSINAPEAIDRLRSTAADLLFVCDYGQILSTACLEAARLGGVNLHGSLLPRHRGAAPVQWTLLRGDPVAGVSVIHMTPRLDAGPILATASTPVQPDETAAELEPRLAQLGADITLPAIELLADWDGRLPIGTPQDSLLVSRAPRFEKRHGQLDFRLPARYLSRLVQAVQPWPGAYAELRLAPHKQLRVIVRRSRWSEHALEGAPGTVRLLTGEQLPWGADERWKSALAVATGRGSFYILEVQPAGKRTMTAAEFARGHALDEAHFLLPEPPVVPLVDDDEG